MVRLICSVCGHRVGVLEGSAGWCWGSWTPGSAHRRRRMIEEVTA